MAGPLQTTMFNGVSDFYNGVITSSLRFNGTNSRLESPTFGGDEGDTWTWSAWVKFTNQADDKRGTLFGVAGNNASLYFDSSGQSFLSINDDGSVVRSTSRLLRDPSSWYHICLNGNGTLNKLWINGVLATFDTNANLGKINEAVVHYIGFSIGSNYYFDGLIADVNFVDGTALDYSAFAEFKNGILIPIEPNVTYSDNGFRLQFKQTGTSANASGIGADTSGNNKHFTVTNFDAHDVLPDSPENNFPTFNALLTTNTGSLSEGNLKSNSVVGGSSKYGPNGSTFLLKSGKWYAEILMIGGSSIGATFSGAVTYRNDSSTRIGFDIAIVYSTSIYSNGGVVQSGLSGISAGDVFGFAVDVDNKTCQVYKNGSTYGSQIDWSGNTYADNGFTGLGHGHGSSLSNSTIAVNYGQDSTFAGNKTSGSENAQDENGIGDFYDTVPSGFLAICSANLPEPTIGPNSDDGNSTDFFDTVLYAGNDTDAHVIPASGDDPTSINFTPDWLSIKTRSGNDNHSHFWINSSKGATKFIKPDATQAEGTDATLMKDIGNTENTWRMGGANTGNGAGTNHVAWLWKNNGGTTSNLSAGSNASVNTNQVNQTAGISFNNFTTSTRDGSDVVFKHGLGVAPDWIMLKGMESNNYIAVYSAAAGGTNLGLLGNDTNSGNVGDDIWVASNGYWGTIDATNVTFADNGNTASSGEEIFAWCFAAKEGFSKFGVYQGNGNADGAFVYTGFRPAFVMIKSTTVAGQYWVIKDTRRDPINPATRSLYWNVSDAEGTGILLDILSNGFKPRTTGNNHNNNGGTYAYMAFAEAPFKYANAR